MKLKILGIGEILWDMLPSGKQLGGTVTNLIYFANLLGAEGYVASSVGKDELGDEIISLLKGIGQETGYIQMDPEHPTGTVDVTLDENGKPSYIIHENTAWDYIQPNENLMELANKADAICFGTLGQRSKTSRKTIREAIDKAPKYARIMCDLNLRQDYFSEEIVKWSLETSDIVKLNDEELPVIGTLCGLGGGAEKIVNRLIEKYSLKMIALTRGDKGSVLYTKDEVSEHPGIPVEVKDSVGAGDSFAAVVVTGVLVGWELDEINERGNIIASYVCSQNGATPKVPEEIINR